MAIPGGASHLLDLHLLISRSSFNSWQKIYSFDPTANMTAKEAKLVQGGQTLLWAEQSGPENVEQQLWPRAGTSREPCLCCF
jgi:hypothetical protein